MFQNTSNSCFFVLIISPVTTITQPSWDPPAFCPL